VRKNGTLTYLFGDHLDPTSLVTDSSGNVISEVKYKACPLRLRYGMLREGEIRYSSGTNPTNYTYTGQYSYTDDFGLMFNVTSTPMATLAPESLPQPSEVTGNILVQYLDAMEEKYGISLPDGFEWDIWDGPLPPPFNQQTEFAYGITIGYQNMVGNNGQTLYALRVYLDTSAFKDLTEIEFASIMIHESRHAWILYFKQSGELSKNGITLPTGGDPRYGSYENLLFEADAYYVQASFLSQYGITSTEKLGNPLEISNNYVEILKGIYNVFPLPFQVPLGVCQPVWCP